MIFVVNASVGNAQGVYDAAYAFGGGLEEKASFTGTPEEIGHEVARYLSLLTPASCQEMEYGTGRFFVQLHIEPVKESS